MKYIKTCLALGLFILYGGSVKSQKNDITLVIKSEHKQLFQESGMINDILVSEFKSKIIDLNKGIADAIRKDIKDMSGQAMHADRITHSIYPYVRLTNSGDKIFLSFFATSNHINFKVTTPDIAYGVGIGEYNDPAVSISYDVRADFELKQGSSSEMIKFISPVWSVKGTRLKASNLQKFSLEKDELDQWYNYTMGFSFKPVYNALFDVKDELNKYIQEVLKNPELQKEFEIAENRQLEVIAEENSSRLVFQHKFSETGYVKRTTNKKADVLVENKVTNRSTTPVSNSPGDVKKKNQVMNTSKKNPTPKRKN